MIKEEIQQAFAPDINDIHDISIALARSKEFISSHFPNGSFTYAAPSCEPLFGYTSAELHGKSIFSFCHPLDLDRLEQYFSSNHTGEISFRFRRKEGDYLWLESSSTNGPSQSEIVLVSRNVTQRVNREEKLKEHQRRDRLFLEHSKDTMGIITRNGVWTYINEQGKKLMGATSFDEIIGTSLYDYTDPQDYKLLKESLDTRNSSDFEISLIRKDNDSKRAEVQLIPTVFKNRDVFLIIIKDITEQRKTEDQLQVAEKLSVIGQMAAGIAHEIRNPLTAIKGFTQLLSEHPAEEAEDYAEIILDELARIESIVGDLLVLAKPQASDLSNADVISLVNGVVNLLNPQATLSDAFIKIKTDTPSIHIDCEPDKIKQVLINLIQNSIESMTTGGEILVTISQEANLASIKVMDQGSGIPEDRLNKLGEPFYSTKEKGTVLGLMICQKIIKNHGGKIDFSSIVNEGTTVTITLPIHDHSTNQEETPAFTP
ncbi:PAS domain S-box protein [Mesobacillus subterraneus]|uniref:ATP-binding protein n=1 Tax=Mesobacillus subterraneus TaxID=285983 RepID=UPI00273E1A61|nr:ATP-binding protein [Mesobacillus subterraneus]WLR57413.1 PAS domain S-box protein [Mesobacillus subterraneus]